MGGKSCPVLRVMANSTKYKAAAIMNQCPVAMKFSAPLALTEGKDEDKGTFSNHAKYK